MVSRERSRRLMSVMPVPKMAMGALLMRWYSSGTSGGAWQVVMVAAAKRNVPQSTGAGHHGNDLGVPPVLPKPCGWAAKRGEVLCDGRGMTWSYGSHSSAGHRPRSG